MSKPEPPVFELNQAAETNSSKIEVIKNLIFGEQLQVYDDEFKQIRKDMLAKKKELDQLIEQIQGDLKHAIDSVSADLNHRITDLEKSIEKRIEETDEKALDKKKLAEMFTNLGEKLSKE
jgi:light-regulated signal transduction histidine kinase (bacteriophytochrome)